MAYSYDAENIRKSVSVDGIVTKHLVDKNRDYAQVIEERDALDNLQVAYTYGDDLISQERGGSVSYYHYDGLGSTRALTDGSETTTDSYTYEAFGSLLRSTGTTTNSYLYTGEQFDPNIGFYYLRARYMNTKIARFLSQDSFQGVNSDPLSLHKYLYSSGDPINNIDPSGYFSLGSFSIGISIRGILSNISVRAISILNRGIKALRSRAWIIYHVKCSSHLSHEFIWALNRKTKRGIGYHVFASYRDALHSARTGNYVPGLFMILPQKRANSVGGYRFTIASKTIAGYLGNVGFALWSALTVGFMVEGDSCPFNYNIPNSSCITWSSKAARNAKLLTLFPF